MNIISTVFGIVGLILLLLVIIPILGAIGSWIALILAIIGLILGVFSSKKTGRNLNAIVILIALLRLWIGGGII